MTFAVQKDSVAEEVLPLEMDVMDHLVVLIYMLVSIRQLVS